MSGKLPGPESPERHLCRRIAQLGSVGFDEFMAVALYHPQGGYYAAGPPRTGRGGDFFTNVSVGPVFGKLLAEQFREMRDRLGCPEDFTLVEQGAHDGQLLADILAAWPLPLPRIIIVEPLANLQALQKKTLAPYAEQVTHVTHESALPPFTGVFFANELLDAFPVKVLARDQGTWLERRVAYDGTCFQFVDHPLTDTSLVPSLPPDVPHFVTEVCPSLAPWIQTVGSKLQRGWLLLIDYGHPGAARHHPARAAGTLAAYRDHQRQSDPLAEPGTQDLTAHVDFTAAVRAGEEAGLCLAGFTDQHHALTALAARLFPGMPEQALDPAAAREMRALRQLLHPESMGTSFKFLALAKNTNSPLTAFQFARDPRQQLFS